MSDDRVGIGVQHRLIGAEDINWDNKGENATEDFLTPFGVKKPLSKINASHIPLDQATRTQLDGPTNVGEALRKLKNTQNAGNGNNIPFNFSPGMSQDTVVLIPAVSNTVAVIQDLVDSCEKDLGGHTLTFEFASGNNKNFNAKLLFTGFHDGKLVVNLNGNSILMSLPLKDGLLRFTDCEAPVEVRNGTLSQNNKTGCHCITAERCMAIECNEISFINNPSDTSAYAFYGLAADAMFSKCTVTNGQFYSGGKQDGNNTWTASGNWIQGQFMRDQIQEALGTLDARSGQWAELLGQNYIVSAGTDSDTGVSWIEYKSGTLIQWGTSSLLYCKYNDTRESYQYVCYANRVKLYKRYKNIEYFVQIAGEKHANTLIPQFDNGNLIQINGSEGYPNISVIGTSEPVFVLGGNNCKKIDSFIFMATKTSYISGIPSFSYGEVANDFPRYSWVTFGTIHNQDKTQLAN